VVSLDNRHQDGAMFDISKSGASVVLELKMPMNQWYTLKISVFKDGVVHNFAVNGRCVHASLARESGFKHGFEFDKPNEAALRSINALTDPTNTRFGLR
jgi:hypothetical protein